MSIAFKPSKKIISIEITGIRLELTVLSFITIIFLINEDLASTKIASHALSNQLIISLF
jgi:hypothetical protein